MDEIKAYYTLIQQAFQFLAPVYNLMTLPLIRVKSQVVDFANPNNGSTVLDVATGTGQQAFAFADRGCSVTGVDITPSMLDIARKYNSKNRVRFQRGDAAHLQFEDNSFDFTCISFALHDMPSWIRERVVGEMVRVTKYEGIIIIVDYDLPTNKFRKALLYRLITLYEGEYYNQFINSDLESLLRETGVRISAKHSVLFGAARILKGSKMVSS